MNLEVYISAPNKTFIAITDDGNLIVGGNSKTELSSAINFGPATQKNFDALISYFERLKIHATDL